MDARVGVRSCELRVRDFNSQAGGAGPEIVVRRASDPPCRPLSLLCIILRLNLKSTFQPGRTNVGSFKSGQLAAFAALKGELT
jgi:hypothetical protein